MSSFLARHSLRGRRGRARRSKRLTLATLCWRELGETKSGSESDAIDAESYAIAQVALALRDADGLARACAEGEPWTWPVGLSVVRRLERAHEHHRAATARALEMAPVSWSVQRRAVSAAYMVFASLDALRASRSTQRVVAHATLALVLQGQQPRGVERIEAAATRLLDSMVAAPTTARGGIEPHRLAVSALVGDLAPNAHDDLGKSALPVTALVKRVYALEGMRCRPNVDFDLTRLDLFAIAASDARTSEDAPWVRLLLRASGVVPPGARVRLACGREGVVMGPGDSSDPWRPEVLVDGVRTIPEERVWLTEARGFHSERS